MFLVNSRHRHFSAALRRFVKLTTNEHPFSRSYGVILPSSLTRVLSSALVHLHPPTCVGLRYGLLKLNLEAFLGSVESTTSDHTVTYSYFGRKEGGFAYPSSLRT